MRCHPPGQLFANWTSEPSTKRPRPIGKTALEGVMIVVTQYSAKWNSWLTCSVA